MNGAMIPPVMQDAELRAQVEPIDQLLDERYHLVEQVAAFWALYGPGGTADHMLSAERCRLNGLLRAMAAAAGGKPATEAALEVGSRAHPDYLTLLAKQTTERAEFFRLNAALEAVEMRVNRGQALLRFASAEVRMTP